MQTPVNYCRIGDRVADGRTVHCVDTANRVAHFTDGSHSDSDSLDVTDFAPATDAEFDL